MNQSTVISAEKTDNLLFGIGGGLIAAAIGAAVWAVVTVLTGYQIGWMAVGVGFLVGFAVRLCGRGSTSVYSIVGAVLALLGCVAGNFLAMVGFAARAESTSFFALLPQVDLSLAVNAMIETAGPMDLLFYGIAIYEGYKLSTVPAAPAPESSGSGS